MQKIFFPKAKDIIESAFLASRKTFISKKPRNKRDTKKALASAKTKVFCDYVYKKLKEASKLLPKLDEQKEFYLDLINIIIDVKKVKECLAKTNSSAEIVRKIRLQGVKEIYRANKKEEIEKAKKGVEGRVCSVVKKLEPCLDFLKNEAKKIEELPEIDFNAKTIVLAGSPNVGKSTLLKRLTKAKPKIAPYKFTTKSLNLGYYEWKYEKVQVIDTPGLLERKEHNKIEQKALVAIKRLSKIVLFIVDPSETCGEKINKQFSLYNYLGEYFKEKKFLIVINKLDISNKEEIEKARELFGKAKIIESTNNEENIKELKNTIWKEIV
ncbi:MAG: GTPase [Candidatus Diapherotrites archaeon]